MNEYEKYINDLKNLNENINYSTMYDNIISKIKPKPFFQQFKIRLAFAGTTLLAIMIISSYFYTSTNTNLFSYITDDGTSKKNQNMIVSYILDD